MHNGIHGGGGVVQIQGGGFLQMGLPHSLVVQCLLISLKSVKYHLEANMSESTLQPTRTIGAWGLRRRTKGNQEVASASKEVLVETKPG